MGSFTELNFLRIFQNLVFFIAIDSGITLSANRTFAQIIPDTTLPNNSNVTISGNTSTINGGSVVGSNLFHSFKDFSIPTGYTAFFANPATIQNIISRVTGKSVSNIDGLIRANSTANLFLINPNGIIFGANAQLDIGGSFIASTASSLSFADGTIFTAQPSQSPPLLTISIPIGLQFGNNPGQILVQGNGQGLRSTPDLIDTNIGLRVQPNQTLALVGGNVTLNGGTLKTAGGRIELGSVAEPGLVNLSPIDKGWALSYNPIQNFGDIQLFQQAAVDASGKSGGDINIQGRRISLTGGSQIESSTLGMKTGGALFINGVESVNLSGTSPQGIITGIGAQVYPEAGGTGSNLTIKTKRLTVQDGAQVTMYTLGAGSGGNLEISADDLVELKGTSPDGFLLSGLYTSALPGSIGNSGNLTIKTGQLLIKDGAQISSGTLGSGSGGDLTVLSRNSIEVMGISSKNNTRFPSAIGTVASPISTGNGGNLAVETQRLIIKDGALISTAALGKGSGGNLFIRANSVNLSNPSLPNFPRLSGLSSRSGGEGKAGNIFVEANQLSVKDNAQITATNTGNGSAGSVYINGRFISLSRQGSIKTSSVSGDGGDIFVNSQIFQLSNSAVEATASGTGDGGNIDITTLFLVGTENSKIKADAVQGNGGNIDITTQLLIFSPDSSITASSQFGLDGIVNINFSPQDPTRGVITVPEIVDQSATISSGCAAQSVMERNTLTVTNNSPLPDFDEHLDNQSIWQRNSVSVESINHTAKPQSFAIKEPIKIVEAQGFVIDPQGNVELVATMPSQTSSNIFSVASSCSSVAPVTGVFPSVIAN
ncbi:filamentous hemagglutinin N-terminal domain-containing protein [Nostoc sp. FACHB-145]|uniref:two-partner secretion domain-containing protein n=1 Tax=Nostoc sp. FACHB-145 TaxID=2692836 RepID=UPI001683EB38|nr:filamentous hemagglutinin N-terminal domain-containing protein [Nostoc sp. FACHB-145]MBD2472612.1 filamentous hemagglutinin N-terminal domain-containing protein [Nostoc sp. FACHB-145]